MAAAGVQRWTAAQDAALLAAVNEHGRFWERIRARVEAAAADDEYALLRNHLGAPASKCLRKRWTVLLERNAAAAPPPHAAG